MHGFGNVVAAIAVLALAGVTWTEPSLAETIVDVATFAQLKAAVHDKTSGPSTLRITNDIYFPTDGSVPSGGIILKYAVRIVGACSSTSLVVSGTVSAGTCMLDAKEVDRHFQVKTAKGSTAEVVFEKLALVNGKRTGNSDDGGAVYAYETGATRFEDDIFKDNTAPGDGGAVYARASDSPSDDSGKATFTSCRFLGNKAYVRSSPRPPLNLILPFIRHLISRGRRRRLSVCDSDERRMAVRDTRAFCL